MIGVWLPELTQADHDAAAELSKKPESKRKSNGKHSPVSNYVGDGILHRVLANRGMLGEQIDPGKWRCKCPRESQHSKGEPFDSSTVYYEPSTGGELGYIHCSHANSGHDRYTLKEWIACFDQGDFDRAREELGILVRRRANNRGNAKTEGASQPIDFDELQEDANGPEGTKLDDGRRVCRIVSAVHKSIDEACEVLGDDPNVYQRDGQLVQVLRIAKSESTASMLAGTPVIRPITVPTLTEKLTKLADWQRLDARKDEWVATIPTRLVVEATAHRGQWKRIRPITGIAEAPMFLADGTIMQTPGYNGPTGYLYLPTCDFPQVSNAPSKTDVQAAATLLREVWAEFPWKSEADLSVMVALLFTILGKAGLGDVPITVVEGTGPGSGKGLAIDCVMTITTGRKANKQNYSADPIEQEKILGGFALQGVQHVNFDDIDTPFGGSPLCKVATCGGCNSFRVLGRSENPDLPWNAEMTATGNNMTFIGDILRRLVVARLEPQVEKPELQTGWKHHPLLDWVLANRGRLVCAALTILRAWHLEGRKTHGCATLGSFEQWAAVVPPACVFAGFANPMDCCPSNQNIEAPETTALRTVIESWPIVAPNGDYVASIIGRLWPEEMHGHVPVDAFEDLRAALTVLAPTKKDGAPPVSKEVGKAFKRLKGRIVGNKKLDSIPGHGGVLKWRVLGSAVVASVASVGCPASNVRKVSDDSHIDTCMGTGCKQPTQATQATNTDEPELFSPEALAGL